MHHEPASNSFKSVLKFNWGWGWGVQFFFMSHYTSVFGIKVWNDVLTGCMALENHAAGPAHEYTSVFEIKVLLCAPLGCIHIETVRPGFFLCTPLVYTNDN